MGTVTDWVSRCWLNRRMVKICLEGSEPLLLPLNLCDTGDDSDIITAVQQRTPTNGAGGLGSAGLLPAGGGDGPVPEESDHACAATPVLYPSTGQGVEAKNRRLRAACLGFIKERMVAYWKNGKAKMKCLFVTNENGTQCRWCCS